MPARIRRMMELEHAEDEAEMERRIREIDRKRKDYYQYYTGVSGAGLRTITCAWRAGW